jgi:hypothetical protein
MGREWLAERKRKSLGYLVGNLPVTGLLYRVRVEEGG